MRCFWSKHRCLSLLLTCLCLSQAVASHSLSGESNDASNFFESVLKEEIASVVLSIALILRTNHTCKGSTSVMSDDLIAVQM